MLHVDWLSADCADCRREPLIERPVPRLMSGGGFTGASRLVLLNMATEHIKGIGHFYNHSYNNDLPGRYMRNTQQVGHVHKV